MMPAAGLVLVALPAQAQAVRGQLPQVILAAVVAVVADDPTALAAVVGLAKNGTLAAPQRDRAVGPDRAAVLVALRRQGLVAFTAAVGLADRAILPVASDAKASSS